MSSLVLFKDNHPLRYILIVSYLYQNQKCNFVKLSEIKIIQAKEMLAVYHGTERRRNFLSI